MKIDRRTAHSDILASRCFSAAPDLGGKIQTYVTEKDMGMGK